MKRLLLLLIVFLATAIVVGGSEEAFADGGKSRNPPPATIRELLVVNIVDGVTVTPGFNSEGFKGDVAAARRQAAGLNQAADPTTAIIAAIPGPAPTTYCWTRDAWRAGTNLVGIRVWEIHHSIYYCYNGIKLTRTPVSWLWVGKAVGAWRYEGEISSSLYWMSYPYSYHAFRQGEFRLCFSWCFQEVHPWITWEVYRDGAAYRAMGG